MTRDEIRSMARSFVGKNEDEVIELCREHQIGYEIVYRDGERLVYQGDYWPTRVNLYIENGIVVKFSIG